VAAIHPESPFPEPHLQIRLALTKPGQAGMIRKLKTDAVHQERTESMTTHLRQAESEHSENTEMAEAEELVQSSRFLEGNLSAALHSTVGLRIDQGRIQ